MWKRSLRIQGIVAVGIKVAALPPEIWADSLAVFSQDLSAPEVSCGVEPVETERSRKCLLGTAAQGLSPGVRTWVLRQVLSS